MATVTDTAYYDADRDSELRDAYYAGISPGDGMREALESLLEDSHRHQLPYAPSQHLYPLVDLHRDELIRSIYSGKTFTAEELIRMDAEIDRARQEEVFRMQQLESGISESRMLELMDDLEAALPYNCEHVVPQSWFGKQNPMRGDLHHLFACEVRCNSMRGNQPYFDFPDYNPEPDVQLEKVVVNCGKAEQNKFEPENNKGVVARAVLYFLLRYPGRLSGHYSTEAEIAMLLNWHQSQEVTLFERHRNWCIQQVQGNRNPLVDFPEWATELFAG